MSELSATQDTYSHVITSLKMQAVSHIEDFLAEDPPARAHKKKTTQEAAPFSSLGHITVSSHHAIYLQEPLISLVVAVGRVISETGRSCKVYNGF